MSIKIGLNTTYGAMGQPGSRLFELYCAATITSQVRQNLQIGIDRARSRFTEDVFANTDSIFFECASEQVAKDFIKDLNSEININVPDLKFVYGEDESYDLIVYPPARKNAYLGLTINNPSTDLIERIVINKKNIDKYLEDVSESVR